MTQIYFIRFAQNKYTPKNALDYPLKYEQLQTSQLIENQDTFLIFYLYMLFKYAWQFKQVWWSK